MAARGRASSCWPPRGSSPPSCPRWPPWPASPSRRTSTPRATCSCTPCSASSRDLRYVEFCERRGAELAAREDIRPPRLLGGHDLIALGYAPARRFGEILAALEDAQLEGRVQTREDAERFVAERYPRSER